MDMRRSSWSFKLFFWFAFAAINVLHADADIVNDTTTTFTTSTTTTGSQDNKKCTIYTTETQGATVRENDQVTVSCQCTSKTPRVQKCPDWMFIKGIQYVMIEEELYDSSDGQYCSATYTFRIRKHLSVGRQELELKCYSSSTSVDLESVLLYVDTPTPESLSEASRSRYSVYIILAIVCFLILTLSLFGFFFRWQMRSRRRSRRAAACRSPFVCNPPNRNAYFSPAVNAAYSPDDPPSYNDATHPQNGLHSPTYNSPCSIDGKPVQERIEKLTSGVRSSKDEDKCSH